MTHLYAYVRAGYSEDCLKKLVANLKQAAAEGFHLRETGSTVAVKELAEDEHSDNFGVLVMVYTAKGKGLDVKKKFSRLLYEGILEALGETGEVKAIIKEQANDMVGLNGVLRCRLQDANADYEES